MGKNFTIKQLNQRVKKLEHQLALRHEIDAALKKKEQRLRFVLEATEDGVWDWNHQTGDVYFSPRYYAMMGYAENEFPASYESWRQRLHPDDTAMAEQAVRRAVEDHTPFAIEFRFKAKDGGWRWILSRGKVVEIDKEGNAIRVAGSHTDITGRKQTEEALQASAEQYRIMTGTSMDGFAIVDGDGKILDINEAYCRMIGYSRDELLTMSVNDIEAMHEPEKIREKHQKVMTGPVRFESRHRCKDESLIDVEISMTFLPHTGNILIFIRDITERKQAKQALEKRIVALTRPLDTSEEIDFEDLFDLSEIQRLQDLYAEAFGVAALITRPDGTPITQPSNFTELCGEIIRKTPKGAKNCNYSDAMVGRHNPSGPNIQGCLSAGLCNAGASITVGGHHVANWLIGQVRNEAQQEEKIMAYAREIGAEEASFRAAYRKVPVMPPEQFDRLAHVLFELANQISTTAYQNVQQARFIAERKRVEEELRQATLVVENSPVMLFRWKAEKGWPVVLVSQNVTQIGYKPKEFLDGSVPFTTVVHPDDTERIDREVQAFCDKGLGRFQQEYRIITKTGQVRWVDDRTVVEKDSQGRITHLQGIVVDITERKRAEETLRRYERIVSSSQDIMALINSDYIYEAVNESFLKNLDMPWEKVVGHTVAEVMGEQVFQAKIKQRLDLAFSGQAVHQRDVFVSPSRRRQIMEVTLFPMKDQKGGVEGVVLNARDITATRKLEEQLVQSQKIESIGTLAGGVAHEINNPINGIMNYAQLILDRTEEENPAKAFAQEILSETQRIASIVRNLLTFARHEKQAHSPAHFSDIVNSVLSLIQTVLRHDQIDLQVEIPDGLPKLKCRNQQIQQVLMNLMTNARDALNERYPGYHAEKQLRVSVRPIEKMDHKFIRTTVEDSGAGIPSEIRARIFDPFFTTKPKESGTGLGLSISYGIVKDHGGELSVKSEPGRFTRFHMDLPVDNGWNLPSEKGDADG